MGYGFWFTKYFEILMVIFETVTGCIGINMVVQFEKRKEFAKFVNG